MPATEVSPQLRRQLSIEARKVFDTPNTGASVVDVRELSLSKRLQKFCANVKLEIPELKTSIHVQLAVSGLEFCYRYKLKKYNIDVCVLSAFGVTTKWVQLQSGENVQLRTYLSELSSQDTEHMHICAFVEMVDIMDLVEVFQASQNAEGVSKNGSMYQTFCGCTLLHQFLFIVDPDNGQPVSVIQKRNGESDIDIKEVRMFVEGYNQFEESLRPPPSIKSDIQLMIDTSMYHFENKWSEDSKSLISDIFDEIDEDSDGFISSKDLGRQLQAIGGQTSNSAYKTSMDMVRLLCDGNDPSEEFDFFQFCGFWMAMLSDNSKESPLHESHLVPSFRQLFLGAYY